jgi:hypothetical protein
VWYSNGDDLARAACTNLFRNLSLVEWQRFLGDVPYRKTYANAPLHPSSLASLKTELTANRLDRNGAIAQRRATLALTPTPGKDSQPEAEEFIDELLAR